MQLIRLDRGLTGELLLRHPEKFSVPSVVGQLKGRRDLQHWYLGLLFARSPETYGAQEYAPFHALQARKTGVAARHFLSSSALAGLARTNAGMGTGTKFCT